MERKRIYFGHPVNVYNTAEEQKLIKKIEKEFPLYDVENPNQVCHDEGYQRRKAETGSGMGYFTEEVLPEMGAGVFLAFEDGMFGAEVFKEAKFLSVLDRPIYEIDLEGRVSKLELDNSRVLSVEETWARVYG